MIKGTTQAFKFTTPYDFNDIDNIIAVFSQSNNTGTTEAPMPITKYYNKNVTEIAEWDESSAIEGTIYYVSTKYYRYNSGWVLSNTQPTEADMVTGEITEYPLNEADTSKVYKCDKSYYRYNPDKSKWDIAPTLPITDIVMLDVAGVIPPETSKNAVCKYGCHYYKWNDAKSKWEWDTALAPISVIPYWKGDETDKTKTYCAEETYYKCIDGTWSTYGSDCIEMVDIYAWDDDKAGTLDKSKIYVLKEFYYEHDEGTKEFKKVAANEKYYKYCKSESGNWEWIEIDDPSAKPKIEAVDAGLWAVDNKDENTTYVCRNIYYSYNSEANRWDSNDIFRLSVIEVDQWDSTDANNIYDKTKIYMCPEKYYQYNINTNDWEEVEGVQQPKVETLNYWTEPGDRDKNKIYLCGPTYYQYDSAKSEWQSSNKFKLQIVSSDTYPTDGPSDQSKVYKCSPTYFAHEGGEWKKYKKPSEIARNDGFSPVDGDTKSFIVALTAEETMRFNDRYKGRVQVDVYCGKLNDEAKNKVAYFPVYPTMIDDVFNYAPSEVNESVVIFDAGKII
jgi:hypothetical protein